MKTFANFNTRCLILFAIAVVCILGLSCSMLSKESEKMLPKGADKVIEGGKQIAEADSDITLEDERAIGEAVALQAYATPNFGVPIKSDEVMKFANCMANLIGQHSDRPLIPYHAAIVKSKELNAFSTPGGYIFVTSGLVELLDNEAQLAMIIGHEIAHITKQHAIENVRSAKRKEGLTNIGQGFLTMANLDKNFEDFQKLVLGLAKDVIAHNYDTSTEKESDLIGVSYAMKAGYDPREMKGVIEKLKVRDHEGDKEHASSADRLAYLEAWLNQRQTPSNDDPSICSVPKQMADHGEPVIDFNSLARDTERFARIKQLIRDFDEKEWNK